MTYLVIVIGSRRIARSYSVLQAYTLSISKIIVVVGVHTISSTRFVENTCNIYIIK